MSQALKIGIGEAIGLGRPLVEARERIIGRAAIRFRQNHMVAFDPVGDLVAFRRPAGHCAPATGSSSAPCWSACPSQSEFTLSPNGDGYGTPRLVEHNRNI